MVVTLSARNTPWGAAGLAETELRVRASSRTNLGSGFSDELSRDFGFVSRGVIGRRIRERSGHFTHVPSKAEELCVDFVRGR